MFPTKFRVKVADATSPCFCDQCQPGVEKKVEAPVVLQSIVYNPRVDEVFREFQAKKPSLLQIVCFYDPRGNALREARYPGLTAEQAAAQAAADHPGQTVHHVFSPAKSTAKRPDGT